MVWVAVGIAAVSAVVAGYSAYAQTKAANAAAEFESRVARRNADIANMQAKDSLERGRVAEKQLRDKQKLLIGQQRAAYGASGVLVDSGSSMDVMQDTIKTQEQDALTVRRNAAMDAWGYRTQGLNYQAQSDMSLLNKRNAGGMAAMAFTTSALNSASSITASKTSTKKE